MIVHGLQRYATTSALGRSEYQERTGRHKTARQGRRKGGDMTTKAKEEMNPLEINQKKNRTVQDEEAIKGLHNRVKWLIDTGTFADLGCGNGHLGAMLPEKVAFNVDCVDRDVPNFHRLDLSHDRLPFKAETVVMLEVLEHLENPWHCIREAKRIGNEIIVSVPNSQSLINRLIFLRRGRFYFFFKENDDHIQPIFRQQLDRMRDDWILAYDELHKSGDVSCIVQKWEKP